MDNKDKKVSINEKPRTYKINQFGKRVIDNWCRYAQFLEKRKRQKLKKNVKISQITEQDEMRFEWALEKLRKERKIYNRGYYTCCAKRPVEEIEEECNCDECLACEHEEEKTNDKNLKSQKKSIKVEKSDPKSDDRKSILKNEKLLKHDNSRTLRLSKLQKSIQSQSQPRPCSVSILKSTESKSKSRSQSRSRSKSKGVTNDKLKRNRSLNLPRKKCSKLDCHRCREKLEAKIIEPPKCEVETTKKAVINYPAVKRKTWIPPHLIPRQKPQRPIVKIPPFKTRPWNPCKVERKPMKSCYGKDFVKKEKPKIKYPPLKMRKM